jgi:valine dehydrogenase (NAD+)
VTRPERPSDPAAEVFALLGEEYEQVVWCHDPSVGLRAVVAVHSTVLGPAMGGTRFLDYPSETAGVVDVLRLARGMTAKQALAGIPYGGGKAVIFGDPARVRTDALLRSYAGFLDRLGGVYLTAEDVGTTQDDMDLIATVTPWVTGTSPQRGGSGDPSPATAWGVFCAMGAVAEHRFGDADLAGRHVVVSGVGKVGGALVDHLCAAGARVTVADVRAGTVAAVRERHGADRVAVVDAAGAHQAACDIFSPCALGAVLHRSTIDELACGAVCGAANNQLGEPADADRLAARDVLYLPDYLANAGGVINISEEPAGYDRARAMAKVAGIAETARTVLARAEADGVTPAAAADALVAERLAIGRLHPWTHRRRSEAP